MYFAFPLALNESLSDQLWVNYTLWESCLTLSLTSCNKPKQAKALVHKACLYTYKLPACRNLLRDIDCATLNSPCHCESHHLPRQLGTRCLQCSMGGSLGSLRNKMPYFYSTCSRIPNLLFRWGYPCWLEVVLSFIQNAKVLVRRLLSVTSNKLKTCGPINASCKKLPKTLHTP